MKKFNFPSALLAILVLGFVAFGCNENTEDPAGEAPAVPTSLKAGSQSSSAVRLQWTASVDNGKADFDGYELTYTPATSTPQPIKIAKGETSYTVTGLTEGTSYAFTLKSRNTANEKSGGVNITWAPARRLGPFKLYGHTSSLASGLALNDNGNPATLTVANGGKWDIAFDTRDGYFIGSPYQTGYIDNNTGKFPNGDDAKKTLVDSLRYTSNITSLDDVFYSSPLNLVTGTFKEQLQKITPTSTQDFAFIIATDANSATTQHYALVQVMSNGGTLVKSDGNGQYIEVMVSYQPAANMPYALSNPNKVNRQSNAVYVGTNSVRSTR